MPDNISVTTPVLEPPLEPGEGRLINIVADYAQAFRDSTDKAPWQELVNYLNSGEVSESAKELGLYMLRVRTDAETSELIRKVAAWYLAATENEKRLEKVLFRSEP
jgi:hypothetical protein